MSGDLLFTPTTLGALELPGRIVRSATYEGMAAADGTPQPQLGRLYERLAAGGAAMITTGFAFVQAAGRAMQPHQAGIHDDGLIAPWKAVIDRARQGNAETRIVLQIAHAGRQTLKRGTGRPVRGAGKRKCAYFRQRVRPMTGKDVHATAGAFGDAARRAREAGFDAVQLHGAHGYLLHQFLSPWTNDRNDEWADGVRFVQLVVDAVRHACGNGFPVLLKLSWADDNTPGIRLADTVSTINALHGVDAVEISYGTMEWALNIIRGDCPVDVALRVNPIFNRMPRPLLALWRRFGLPVFLHTLKPFAEDYNLDAALAVKQQTDTPVYPVGGFRTADSLRRCVGEHGFPAVALCRPLIREPDWPRRIREDHDRRSGCINCNLCTVHVDSDKPLQCHSSKGT